MCTSRRNILLCYHHMFSFCVCYFPHPSLLNTKDWSGTVAYPRWFCFSDVDECANGPCKNGGKCTNTPGGYKCTCVGGWYTGRNCDEGESWQESPAHKRQVFQWYGEVTLQKTLKAIYCVVFVFEDEDGLGWLIAPGDIFYVVINEFLNCTNRSLEIVLTGVTTPP